MNSKTGLFAAAWAVSFGAAFMIGRTSSSSTDSSTEVDSEEKSLVESSRRGDRGAGGSSRRSRVTRSSGDAPSGDRLTQVRKEIKDLKKMSDPLARAQGFLDFVRNLGPDEFLDAVDAFREGGVEDAQFGEYRLLLASWAQVDPLGALDYASEKTGTSFARQTILAAWAKTNTEDAVAWARDNFDNKGDGKRANPWLVGVIEGLSSSNLGRATQLLEELPFSRERGQALGAIFSEVSGSGTETAKEWVAGLTDERLKAGAAARLAGKLAAEDPQEAAAWATSMGPDIMKQAAGQIVETWADEDLSGAQVWLENQSEDVIASAGPNLVEEMIRQGDPVAASNWLQSYEGNPEFDSSVRTLVWNSMEKEPALAADWIMKLTREEDQTRTFHRVMRGWMQRDRAGALDYINNNPVPESVKNRANQADQ